MTLYTIGWAQRPARDLFEVLREVSLEQVIDIRLRNTGQLAGYTKRVDLEFFVTELLDATYVHEPLLAPTDELLDGLRLGRLTWDEYEPRFLALLRERRVQEVLSPTLIASRSVLLCTEPTPDHCHRRLVAEHLTSAWGGGVAHL